MSRLEEINTYPEMNELIKDILRRSDEQHEQYILKRIIELEEELQKDVVEEWGLMKQNQRYKQALETASSEVSYALFSNKSDDVKKIYIENSKRIIDEALAGDNS